MKTQRLTELLTELIAVPSVNPAHGGPPEVVGERRMADHIAALLRERGLEAEYRDYKGPERPAVVGTTPEVGGPTLMFELHLDTVGVANMTIDPFKAEIRDGRLTGRGSCDMKGSIAALFHALTPERVRALTERGVRLMVVGAPDEETGTHGARKLVEDGLRADVAVVLEPTRCRPVIAHKGARWYEMTLRGRGGHGSQPQSGVSTNAALAELLPRLFRLHDRIADEFRHPLLGVSTLNLGRIDGGHTFNLIPDHTLLQLDRRQVPGEPEGLFEQEVEALLDDLVRDGKLVGGDLRRATYTEAFATNADGPLVRSMRDAIRDVTGAAPEPEGTSWVSDAAPLSRVCGETLVFGPGDIAQAHTSDEYIELDQLETGAAVFARFLDAFDPGATR